MECTAAVGDFPSKRKMQGVLRTNYDRPTSAALITGRQRRRSIYRDLKLCCESQHNMLCCDKSQHNTTYCCVVTAFICRLALVGHRINRPISQPKNNTERHSHTAALQVVEHEENNVLAAVRLNRHWQRDWHLTKHSHVVEASQFHLHGHHLLAVIDAAALASNQ